ncbi:unnamed protein product [Peniophora sp. CBMAI 1063]|nr:unnamed protein product [Peniophora sp. CBMAI 1063]
MYCLPEPTIKDVRPIVSPLDTENVLLDVQRTPYEFRPRVRLDQRARVLRLLNSAKPTDKRVISRIGRLLTGDEDGYIHDWYDKVRNVKTLYIWHNKIIHPRADAHVNARYSAYIHLAGVRQRRAGPALAYAVLTIVTDGLVFRGWQHRPRVVDIAYSIEKDETVAVVLFDELGVLALNVAREAEDVRVANTGHLIVARPDPRTVHALAPDSLIKIFEVVQWLVNPMAYEARNGRPAGILPRLLGAPQVGTRYGSCILNQDLPEDAASYES